MATIVIIPGGYHPYHAGHLALYQSAQRAFPDAEVFVAATNDTSTRPFPFPVKEKLARLAGVEPGHFVQVKSPFRAEEITAGFDPNKDQLIFVRSEKDSTKPPQPGGTKKDGSPAYLQPLLGAKKLEPFARHAYMAYLPTVPFGPGMTSATEIRSAWPTLNDKRKTALVMSLYPRTQGNARLAATVVGLLDAAIGTEQDVAEGSSGVSVKKWAAQVRKDHGADVKFFNRQEGGGAVDSVIARNSQGETVGVYNRKTGFPTVFEPKQGVAEGIFGLTSKEKAKIQYVTAKISDIPGNWDHKNQQYTERGLADLKSVMKNEKYLKYALSLTSDDFEAEGVAEGLEDKVVFQGHTIGHIETDSDGDPVGIVYSNNPQSKRPFEIFGYEDVNQLKQEMISQWNKRVPKGVAEGLSDIVKGVKRKVAGKADPKEVEHMYGRIARSAIKYKTPDQAEKDIERYKKVAKVVNKEGVVEAEKKCPPATQDITLNLQNRQKAIDEYGYGPLNPDLPNTKFWMKKVSEWNLDSMEEAQQSLCGNCAAFDIRQDTLDCIAQGIDSDSPEDAEGVIDVGELGYCKFLKFKCASRRTCDAWVTGGPLRDKAVEENQGWAATLESDQVDVATDPELVHARRFAKQHYPEFSGDEDLAFAKWVQRGLGHSEKNDREHDRKLKQLTTKVAMLQAALQQQAKNSDYMEESSRKK